MDLQAVRVHTDARAQRAARLVSARAFAYGNHIFLGSGEQPTDLGLLAHEVAHVVQQQGAPALQRWAPGQRGPYEQEAHKASDAVLRREPFAVNERTRGPRVQRLGLSDALDYFADRVNMIPGFRMFTLIVGVNPVNMRPVERSAANILRAVVEFMPGGGLITQALDNYGVFERVGAWVEQQLASLGMTGSSIRDAINAFLDSLSWDDIFDLEGVWNRAQRLFTEPIDRIISFVRGLVSEILRFIREAILRPLAQLAQGTRGYDLLKAVLGQDPITGEPAPRDANTLIGGFMRLIGQEEIWNNLQRSNAVPRAWAWFQGALASLLGFVRQIPGLFVQALQSLQIADLVHLPQAFARVAGIFGSFIGNFLSWAGNAVWNLLEIIFSVVAPGVMVYLRRAAAAFRTILRDPIAFVGNLVRAGLQGLRQFAANFLTHLRGSLIGWLTGAMSGANIYIPQGFNLREIVKFVLSVLGLTWQNIRQKLVRAIGETAVRALETGFEIIRTLVTEGPAAAWERIRESLSNLRELVMEQIMTFVRDRVVQAAITRLVTSLNPAGAFIQAIIATYNTVMFFIERMRQIAQVAAAFIDSISAIANGVIAAAADRVEQTMAGLLTLVISFLARIAGLGRVSDAVTNVINRVRAPIDRALDRVVDWIVAQARRLGRLITGAVRGRAPDTRTPAQKQAALNSAVAEARQLDATMGRRRLLAALQRIRERFRLATLTGVPAAAGHLRVQATINPEVTFELADYDDAMLEHLHAAFVAASALVGRMDATQRTEAAVLAVFQREVRQRHAGIAVTLRRSGDSVEILGTPPGLRAISLGRVNLVTGVAAMADDVALRGAVIAARQAVEALGANATWEQAVQVFTTQITQRIRGAALQFQPARDVGGREAYLTVSATERRFLGIIVTTGALLYQVVAQRGAQQLLRNRVSGAEFVRAARDLIVQRYVWRNVNPTERDILTDKAEVIEAGGPFPNLPPRPMAPDAPRGLRRQVATDPFTHVINAQMASIYSSATTIEGGQIVNRVTGQVFNVSGTLQIDLFQIDPSRIVVLSTAAGRRAWGLVTVNPTQAELDAGATREVLIQGGIPGVAIVSYRR